MLIKELLNNVPDIVREESPLIILDRKSAACMANICKKTSILGTFQGGYIL